MKMQNAASYQGSEQHPVCGNSVGTSIKKKMHILKVLLLSPEVFISAVVLLIV